MGQYRAWIKLSEELPLWPCLVILNHPLHALTVAEINLIRDSETVYAFLSGPPPKEFYDKVTGLNQVLDNLHEGSCTQGCYRKSSTIKPFLQNFEINYRAVMDGGKWGHMSAHFAECVKACIEDHDAGLLLNLNLNHPTS